MYYRHKNVIREMNWDKKIRSTSFVRCDNILEWVYFLSHYPPIEPSSRPQYIHIRTASSWRLVSTFADPF